MEPAPAPAGRPRAGIGEVIREWGRIGCIGFGGPPTHIALLRELCVQRRKWLSVDEFEHAIAACNLLPGPASTQLALFCAWRVAGGAGLLAGGLAFILPGLLMIVPLAALFLAGAPPAWVRGAGAGAGAAVAAVALRAGSDLAPASWSRAHARPRWLAFALVGALAAALVGPWLVVVLLGCGLLELALRRSSASLSLAPPLAGRLAHGAIGLPLAWSALKIGALAFGGGFVIIPLMQSEAVTHHHWLTATQFLNAVALGQVTPGPVVLTVAVIGYAVAGVGGAAFAAAIAFAPSFLAILLGARHFESLRTNRAAKAFLDGAGPAAIGAILGAAVPLALALRHGWQVAVLALAAIALLGARRAIVPVLLGAGALGAVAALAGASV